MTEIELTQRIEQRISEIPAHNSGVISFVPTTLRNELSRSLIRKIAEVAAHEAMQPEAEPTK